MGGTAPYWRSAPSGEPDGRAEQDLAGREVEGEVLVVRAAGGEVADLVHSSQPSSSLTSSTAVLVGGDDGTALEREPLARDALGDPDLLVRIEVGVHRRRRCRRW